MFLVGSFDFGLLVAWCGVLGFGTCVLGRFLFILSLGWFNLAGEVWFVLVDCLLV